MPGLTFNSNLGLQFPQNQVVGLMGDAPGTGLTPPTNAINPQFQQPTGFSPQLWNMAARMMNQGQPQQQQQQQPMPMMQMPQWHPSQGLQFPQMSYTRFHNGMV